MKYGNPAPISAEFVKNQRLEGEAPPAVKVVNKIIDKIGEGVSRRQGNYIPPLKKKSASSINRFWHHDSEFFATKWAKIKTIRYI